MKRKKMPRLKSIQRLRGASRHANEKQPCASPVEHAHTPSLSRHSPSSDTPHADRSPVFFERVSPHRLRLRRRQTGT